MNNSAFPSLLLSFEPSRIFIFFQLLENGFIIKGKVGCSVKEFLCNRMFIEQEYLDKRIQTIFLNGKPVDDVNSAIVKDGSAISLSAAMPGLAGATMRKGGVLAAMRSGISCVPAETGSDLYEGKVTIKFFNLISKELGPEFLNRGIIIEGRTLSGFFGSNRKIIEAGLFSAETDGAKIETEKLFNIKWEDKAELLLKVIRG
jgi:predicted RecA/RadA family phage recombinase